MKKLGTTTLALVIGLVGLLLPASSRSASDDMLVVRSTAKTPDAVVEAVKAYAEQQKWQYLGASKVKQGQVILVKLCIPEVGRQIWPAGLRLSAMLPCGNLGVYRKDGTTEISLLHPRYLSVLFPGPATDQASAIATPLLMAMLDTVAR